MHRDNCLNDGKAEAASPARASTCPVNAEEAVEDEGQIICIDTCA